MSSIDPPRFGPEARATLLDLARRSIAHGLDHRRPLAVDPTHYRSPLSDRLAAFVTLDRAGQLRGCIGHLEAMQPLVRDVADNAYAAAFAGPAVSTPDPRRADRARGPHLGPVAPGAHDLHLRGGPAGPDPPRHRWPDPDATGMPAGPFCPRCGSRSHSRGTFSPTSSARPGCRRTIGPIGCGWRAIPRSLLATDRLGVRRRHALPHTCP